MWYDITRPITAGMPVYPGDPPVRLERAAVFPAVSYLSLGMHSGTHVDSPAHLGLGGGVETIPLDALCGPARVVAFGAPPSSFFERMLLKGDGVVSRDMARSLVERGVRLVGVEGMSIEEGLEAHEVLLTAGVAVVEGLDLSGVPEGLYDLFCLPLRIEGGDGALVRAVLRKGE